LTQAWRSSDLIKPEKTVLHFTLKVGKNNYLGLCFYGAVSLRDRHKNKAKLCLHGVPLGFAMKAEKLS
jgi:hypothetical protein